MTDSIRDIFNGTPTEASMLFTVLGAGIGDWVSVGGAEGRLTAVMTSKHDPRKKVFVIDEADERATAPQLVAFCGSDIKRLQKFDSVAPEGRDVGDAGVAVGGRDRDGDRLVDEEAHGPASGGDRDDAALLRHGLLDEAEQLGPRHVDDQGGSRVVGGVPVEQLRGHGSSKESSRGTDATAGSDDATPGHDGSRVEQLLEAILHRLEHPVARAIDEYELRPAAR